MVMLPRELVEIICTELKLALGADIDMYTRFSNRYNYCSVSVSRAGDYLGCIMFTPKHLTAYNAVGAGQTFTYVSPDTTIANILAVFTNQPLSLEDRPYTRRSLGDYSKSLLKEIIE